MIIEKRINLLCDYLHHVYTMDGSDLHNFKTNNSNVLIIMLLKLRFCGWKYYCNLCGTYLSTFLYFGSKSNVVIEKQIIGAQYRKMLCPKCQSKDRDRATFHYINKQIKEKEYVMPLNILHLAPEKQLSNILSKKTGINYICGDKFEAHYTLKDFNKAVIYIDLNDMQFSDEYFDIIVCNHVLEHIENDIKAMKELFRVLKYGGVAILQVPYSVTIKNTYEDPLIKTKAKRLLYYGQFDHVRIYAKQDYINRLINVGFTVRAIDVYKDLGYKKAIKMGLDCQEELIVCEKI